MVAALRLLRLLEIVTSTFVRLYFVCGVVLPQREVPVCTVVYVARRGADSVGTVHIALSRP